MNKHSIN